MQMPLMPDGLQSSPIAEVHYLLPFRGLPFIYVFGRSKRGCAKLEKLLALSEGLKGHSRKGRREPLCGHTSSYLIKYLK